MGCGSQWSWSSNGVRKVECVRVRGNSPRVFAGWGCHSFAAEVAVFGRRRTTDASAGWPKTPPTYWDVREWVMGGGERRNRSGGARSGLGGWWDSCGSVR